MHTKSDRMGYGLLLLAGLFLWNPVIEMLDPLPDLAGYLLLLFGLARLTDLSDRMDEAREKFHAAIWISVFELLSEFLINVFLRNVSVVDDVHGQNLPMWILLFSFVAMVMECWFLIPAFRTLFSGLEELAVGYGASHIRNDRHERSQYARMATLSTALIICKNLFSVLPEVTTLTTYEAGHESTIFTFDWYSYSDVFRLILLVPSLIVGVLWLVCWIRTFSSAGHDGDYLQKLREKYDEKILSRPTLLRNRRLSFSFVFFRFGIAFSAVLLLLQDKDALTKSAIRGVELLPDWCAVIFLAAGVILTKDLVPVRKSEWAVGIPAFFTSLAQWLLCLFYFREYGAMDARFIPAAYERMIPLQIVGTVSAVLLGLCLLLTFRRVWDLLHLCLQVNYEGEELLSLAATRRLWDSFRPRFVWALVMVCVSTAGKIANLFLRPYFGWVWWIPMLATVILALILTSISSEFLGEIAVHDYRKPGDSDA